MMNYLLLVLNLTIINQSFRVSVSSLRIDTNKSIIKFQKALGVFIMVNALNTDASLVPSACASDTTISSGSHGIKLDAPRQRFLAKAVRRDMRPVALQQSTTIYNDVMKGEDKVAIYNTNRYLVDYVFGTIGNMFYNANVSPDKFQFSDSLEWRTKLKEIYRKGDQIFSSAAETDRVVRSLVRSLGDEFTYYQPPQNDMMNSNQNSGNQADNQPNSNQVLFPRLGFEVQFSIYPESPIYTALYEPSPPTNTNRFNEDSGGSKYINYISSYVNNDYRTGNSLKDQSSLSTSSRSTRISTDTTRKGKFYIIVTAYIFIHHIYVT